MDKRTSERGISRGKIFHVKTLLKNLVVGVGLLVLFTHAASAQWVQVREARNVYCLAVSDSNIFVGSLDSGIFLSTSNGTSWTPVNSGLLNGITVYSFDVNGGNIFAGTYGGAGVYLSTNGGTNWNALSSGITNADVWSLAVSGSDVFAGTGGGGVFLSTNNGANWTAANSGLTRTEVASLAVTSSNVFAGTDSGLFLSTNNGRSWTIVESGLSRNYYVSSLRASGSNIFAGTYGGGVFLSSNNGTSWTPVDSGLPDTIMCLVLSGSNIFAGTHSEGIFLSTNDGTSWSAVNSGFPANSTALSLAVSSSTVFVGTGDGVWRRPISEMVGVINPNPHQGISNPNASGFKINVVKNGIAVLLPETLNDGAITVELVNIAGRKIYSAAHQAYNGILKIPLLGLSAGTYLMSITGSKTTLSSSFVVTK